MATSKKGYDELRCKRNQNRLQDPAEAGVDFKSRLIDVCLFRCMQPCNEDKDFILVYKGPDRKSVV